MIDILKPWNWGKTSMQLLNERLGTARREVTAVEQERAQAALSAEVEGKDGSTVTRPISVRLDKARARVADLEAAVQEAQRLEGLRDEDTREKAETQRRREFTQTATELRSLVADAETRMTELAQAVGKVRAKATELGNGQSSTFRQILGDALSAMEPTLAWELRDVGVLRPPFPPGSWLSRFPSPDQVPEARQEAPAAASETM